VLVPLDGPVSMASSSSSLSFPPLLSQSQWKGASQGRAFPGGDHTWKKSLAPRPLRHVPDKGTVSDLQASTGPHFNLLHQTVQLPADSIEHLGLPATLYPAPQRPTNKMPLYDSVWPDTTVPTFSVWDYCQKRGHAVPANYMPAPKVNDMKGWFATYGQPRSDQGTGFRSEFTATTKPVLHATHSEPSQKVRMYKGRVLR